VGEYIRTAFCGTGDLARTCWHRFPVSFDRQNLHPFGPEIWIADGSVASFYGFPYSTRMAVIRLSDGSLFVWSPVALSTALRAAVDTLGPVRYLVSPNALHHLFLAEWTTAYPAARLYGSPRLRRKRRDLSFNAELGDAPEPAWAGDIDQVVLHGSCALTEIVFFHRHSRTALFADLIQNFPRDWFKGWRGVAARLGGIVAPHPSAPSDWRLSFVNRRAARAALARVLAWPIERVVIAHGVLPTAGGAAFVRRAFAWLLRLDRGAEQPSDNQHLVPSRLRWHAARWRTRRRVQRYRIASSPSCWPL
jgi:Domain of unknown function (DUF4336)